MASGRTVRQVKHGERLRRIQSSLNHITTPTALPICTDNVIENENGRWCIILFHSKYVHKMLSCDTSFKRRNKLLKFSWIHLPSQEISYWLINVAALFFIVNSVTFFFSFSSSCVNNGTYTYGIFFIFSLCFCVSTLLILLALFLVLLYLLTFT